MAMRTRNIDSRNGVAAILQSFAFTFEFYSDTKSTLATIEIDFNKQLDHKGRLRAG